MGGSDDSGNSTSTMHYAEFWENALSDMLNHSGEDSIDKSVYQAINDALGGSPYGGGVFLDPAVGYFGSGYGLGDFPSLFDMYGKFMAGVDVHTLWEQTYAGLTSSPAVGGVIAAEGNRLSDDYEQVQYPRLHAGLRDIGAVHSSAFAMGRALLEFSRSRNLEDFSAKTQLALLDTSTKMWGPHLDWNRAVVESYHALQQGFQSNQREANSQNMEFAAKDGLWDLSLYEYGRAVLGAISGADGTSENPLAEPSQVQKSVAGAASGAAIGGALAGASSGTVSGPVGIAIGAVLGLAMSFM